MENVNNNSSASALSQIMASIDLGPTSSLQFMMAKLQLANSMICKSQAEDQMKQIEKAQAEQKAVAEMISDARKLQEQAEESGKCTTMPTEMETWMKKRGLAINTAGNSDRLHNKDEWAYNIQSLTDYQQSISNDTQTMMVFLQDFIGQYNSYLQGANSAVQQGNQTLQAIATGR